MIDVKKLQEITVEGVDRRDYPDFVDAFVSSAEWDDGKPLTDAELTDLNDNYSDFVYEYVMDNIINI